jgi:hypothetical protein
VQDLLDLERDDRKYADLYNRVAIGRDYMETSEVFKAITEKLPLGVRYQTEGSCGCFTLN